MRAQVASFTYLHPITPSAILGLHISLGVNAYQHRPNRGSFASEPTRTTQSADTDKFGDKETWLLSVVHIFLDEPLTLPRFTANTRNSESDLSSVLTSISGPPYRASVPSSISSSIFWLIAQLVAHPNDLSQVARCVHPDNLYRNIQTAMLPLPHICEPALCIARCPSGKVICMTLCTRFVATTHLSQGFRHLFQIFGDRLTPSNAQLATQSTCQFQLIGFRDDKRT